jgi:hypothetical protein
MTGNFRNSSKIPVEDGVDGLKKKTDAWTPAEKGWSSGIGEQEETTFRVVSS